MSYTYGEAGPPSGHPDAHAPATWNPLVGTAGWSPGAESQGHQPPPEPGQPPYQHGYAPTGYTPPGWVAPTPAYPYAVWIRRVGAYLIDFTPAYVAMIPFYIGYAMFYASLIRYTTSLPSNPNATPPDLTGTPLTLLGIGIVAMLAALGWQWYNRWLTAGRTGQSMGKRVLNTKLVAEVNGQPIGPVNAFLRDLLHVLDGIAYLGFLWPLWDTKRQTFADMIMKTVVTDLRVEPAPAGADHHQTLTGGAA